MNGCSDDSFDCEIEEADVLNALRSINVSKGAGPDGVSPKLLKNGANSLAKPLTVLFRKSLQMGQIPIILKESKIVPIFKSGKKNSVTNDVPIAILYGSLMHKNIESFMNGKINQNQHSFVKNRSTAIR